MQANKEIVRRNPNPKKESFPLSLKKHPIKAMHMFATKVQRIVKQYLKKLGKTTKGQNKKLIKDQKAMNQTKVSQEALKKLKIKFNKIVSKGLYAPDEDGFKTFCIDKIKSMFKMQKIRRKYKYKTFIVYDYAARDIQNAWKAFKNRKPKKSKKDIAVEKIQNAWKCFQNKKTFKYYKNILNFKLRGDPSHLLKSINPKEAQLFDVAANVHVRFRFGGEHFPPLIYYKIFVHGPVCDVNSFAPRNYSKIKKEIKKEDIDIHDLKDKLESIEDELNSAGWYVRQENNGWRLISDKILKIYDPVEIITSKKPKIHHFKKDMRLKLNAQHRRRQKLRWLRQMYKDAKKNEEQKEKENLDDGEEEKKEIDTVKKQKIMDESNLQEMNDDEFEKEVNNLIDWCEELDYDAYTKEWYITSTSAIPNLEERQKESQEDLI